MFLLHTEICVYRTLNNGELDCLQNKLSPIDINLEFECWTSVFRGFAEYLLRNRAVASRWHRCFIPATDEGFRGPLETMIDSHVKLQKASRRHFFPHGLTGCNFP